MKRKYADRRDWARIERKSYAQSFVNDDRFQGYVTMVTLEKVREPLIVTYGAREVRIVDDGYRWMLHVPVDGAYAVTTTFDRSGEVVQWYFDIVKSTGLGADGIPYIDDLYLDVVLLPDGSHYVLDVDELEEALANKQITDVEFQAAHETMKQILASIGRNDNGIVLMCKQHLELLLKQGGNA